MKRKYTNNQIINDIKFHKKIRDEENKLYTIIDFDDKIIEETIDYFIDFSILCCINYWKINYITEAECNKIIDIIDGYVYAQEEGFITNLQLHKKIKSLLEEISNNDFNFLVLKKEV